MSPAAVNGDAHTVNGVSSVPDGTYGFIGIGVMGYGMAANLRAKLPKSTKLVICEVDQERRDNFFAKEYGLLEAVQSPREVVEKSDVIITMLPKGQHVRDVFTNPSNGLLSIPQGGSRKIFLECSTIEVATSVEVRKSVAESGLGMFVDAPVSGGPKGSVAGTLTFMVGGSEDEVKTVKPILELMGKNIFHCGGAGAGLATKCLNNYAAWVSFLGLCEVMNTGMKFGLDPKVLAGVLNASSGTSWNSVHENPVKGVTPNGAASRDFKGGFTLELCKGVNEMAMALQEQVGAKSILAPAVHKLLDTAAQNEKCAGQECRSVWRLFAENDGHDLD